MPGLPSRDELQKLPWRAIVAYATDCANRCEPSIYAFPDLADQFSKVLGLARRVASDDDHIPSASEINERRDIADQAAFRFSHVEAADGAVFATYRRAARGIEAVSHVAQVLTAVNVANAARSAAEAADSAVNSSKNPNVIVGHARETYDVLSAMADAEDWDDTAPVPAEFFDLSQRSSLQSKYPVRPFLEEEESELELFSSEELIQIGDPDLVIAFDSDLISPEDYADLVSAIGDIVRAEGGAGVVHVKREGYDMARTVEPAVL